jgi:hypothetical protein
MTKEEFDKLKEGDLCYYSLGDGRSFKAIFTGERKECKETGQEMVCLDKTIPSKRSETITGYFYQYEIYSTAEQARLDVWDEMPLCY